jgi:transposase
MSIKRLKGRRDYGYDEVLKSRVCFEILSGGLSFSEAKARYGIRGEGTLYRWMEKYKQDISLTNLQPMNPANPSAENTNPAQHEDLVKKNQELQEALEMAKLKITTLEVMIDIAESELNIDIRKKSGTKQ